jgi:hypothetical protein
MIRYFLARGDRAGSAMITDRLEHVMCSNPPPRVQIATLDMKTYCTACKREGYIAPKGARRPGTGPNGKPWALSGDINVCGYNPPPVFYAERGMKMTFTSQEVATLTTKGTGSTATEAQSTTATRASVSTYDEQGFDPLNLVGRFFERLGAANMPRPRVHRPRCSKRSMQ